VEGVETAAVAILPATWAGAARAPRIGASPTGGVRVVRPGPGQMIHVTDASDLRVRAVEHRS
jgi:hypothetical protein